MKFYTINPIIKKVFSNYVWESSDGICLTFDDGPLPENTDLILKWLNEKNLKAIFFCVGDNISKCSSIAQEIISEGHSIGNHTYNHKILSSLLFSECINQIGLCNDIAKEVLNINLTFFRPPHGRLFFNQTNITKKFGLTTVMWSLLPYDFKNDINISKFSIDKYLKNNSIVSLHDSLKSKKIIELLEHISEVAAARGFKFGAPAECLKLYS